MTKVNVGYEPELTMFYLRVGDKDYWKAVVFHPLSWNRPEFHRAVGTIGPFTYNNR